MLKVIPHPASAHPQAPAMSGYGYGVKMAARDQNMNGYASQTNVHPPNQFHGRINPFIKHPHNGAGTPVSVAHGHSRFPNSDGVYAEILPVSPLHSRYDNTDTWINPAFNSPVHSSQSPTHNPRASMQHIYANPIQVKPPGRSPSATSGWSVSSPAHSASSSSSSNMAVAFFTRYVYCLLSGSFEIMLILGGY